MRRHELALKEIARYPDESVNLCESLASDLEEAGSEVACNAVIGDRTLEPLIEDGMIKACAAAGVSLQHAHA